MSASQSMGREPGDRAVVIDGQRFLWSELSASARTQLNNLQALDEHIAQLQRLIKICEAAESAYMLALRVEVAVEEGA